MNDPAHVVGGNPDLVIRDFLQCPGVLQRLPGFREYPGFNILSFNGQFPDEAVCFSAGTRCIAETPRSKFVIPEDSS